MPYSPVVTQRPPISPPAYATVSDDLRQRILTGELSPGDRLPAEGELSSVYKVGRSTVREALRALASQHLIVTTRGPTGGSFVAVPQVETIGSTLEVGVGLLTAVEGVTVEQLMEVRTLLEVPAAAKAASAPNQELLERLRGALYDPATTPGPDTFAHNQEFHLALLGHVANPILEVVAATVFRVLATRFGREAEPVGFWRQVDRDHRRILAAIAAGDAEGAEEAMAAHMGRLGRAYGRMDRRLRSDS